jgi:hypothetical protein
MYAIAAVSRSGENSKTDQILRKLEDFWNRENRKTKIFTKIYIILEADKNSKPETILYKFSDFWNQEIRIRRIFTQI